MDSFMRFPSVFLFLSPCLFAVAAIGQTIQSPSPNPSSGQTPQADQPTIDTSTANSNPSSTELSPVVVIGQLNEARDQIVPYLGATRYSVGQEQIQTQSQGSNAPFNQVILRMPGVAQDSYGQLHVRGEHANLQFRIDDVLIPEGITGFGQEIDTHWVKSVDLITGTLPAQFGFRTSGIIDIHTKEGTAQNGGDLTYYGGSHETIFPSFQIGGAQGRLNYYAVGSYKQDDLGIENPTGGYNAIHDWTEQYKGFANLSYLIDDSSRISLLLSGTYSDFQIPANPGQTPLFALAGASPKNFNSRFLSENQHEQNHFAILAYQKSFENVSFQLAAFTRYSSTLFTPDDGVILSSPAWRDGSTEASFRMVFSSTRAGRSLIPIFCGEGFLSRQKLRGSTRITRFFQSMAQEIRHPMFRSLSLAIRERPAPITASISRTHGKFLNPLRLTLEDGSTS